MAKVSRESAEHIELHGPVEDRHQDVDGYTVTFVTFNEEIDGAPLLKGLPGDACDCAHWGYVFKGKVTFRTAAGDEIFGAGDAFYVGPGHTPFSEAGSEMLMFSPSDQLHAVEAVMMKNMGAMMQRA